MERQTDLLYLLVPQYRLAAHALPEPVARRPNADRGQREGGNVVRPFRRVHATPRGKRLQMAAHGGRYHLRYWYAYPLLVRVQADNKKETKIKTTYYNA